MDAEELRTGHFEPFRLALNANRLDVVRDIKRVE
jgi:hypothetical protein